VFHFCEGEVVLVFTSLWTSSMAADASLSLLNSSQVSTPVTSFTSFDISLSKMVSSAVATAILCFGSVVLLTDNFSLALVYFAFVTDFEALLEFS
jgi:hypothetical protein